MEKKLIRILLAFCLVTGFATKSIAQNLSTYEQKRYKLADNTISAMAEEDVSIALVWAMLRSRYIEENGPFEDFMSDVYFTESIIEAIGLGTSFMGTDSWAEYAQKQEFKRLYQSWRKQRDILDKQRTAVDIEHERRLKAISREPRGGTVEDLSFTLKKEFGKWGKKGEYEKTIEYEHRLNTKGIEHFDSLCLEHSNKVWLRSEYVETDMQYDADREVYSFTMTYGDSLVGRKQIIGECNMPVEIAKETGEAEKMILSEAQVVEGFVVPKRISFWIKSRSVYRIYDFVFPDLPNATPLNICVSNTIFNLKGNVDTLRNHCFSLNKHYHQQKSLNRNLFKTHLQTKKMFDKLEKEYSDAVAKYDNPTSYKTGDFPEFDKWFKRSYDKSDIEFMSTNRFGNYWYYRNDWETLDVRKWLALPFKDVEVYYTMRPHLHKKQYEDIQAYIAAASSRLNEKISDITDKIFEKRFEEIDKICSLIKYSNYSPEDVNRLYNGTIKKIAFEGNQVIFTISKYCCPLKFFRT